MVKKNINFQILWLCKVRMKNDNATPKGLTAENSVTSTPQSSSLPSSMGSDQDPNIIEQYHLYLMLTTWLRKDNAQNLQTILNITSRMLNIVHIYMHCILVGHVSLSELEVFDTSDPVLFLPSLVCIVSHWFTVLLWMHHYWASLNPLDISSYSQDPHPLSFLLSDWCDLFSGDQIK